MASSHGFLHQHALSSPSSLRNQVAAKPTQFVCRAHQKQAAIQEDGAGLLSRRLALTVLIGAAAVATKVSPSDAAYGEAGIMLIWLFVIYHRS